MTYSGTSIKRAGVLAAVVLAACAACVLAGCAAKRDVAQVKGTAHAYAGPAPGEARRTALQAAQADAYAQMLKIAEKIPVTEGRTIADLMSQSPYVAARVRRAIQRSPVIASSFSAGGRAEVVMELDVQAVQAAAIRAEVDLAQPGR